MRKLTPLPKFFHELTGSTLLNWIKLLRRNSNYTKLGKIFWISLFIFIFTPIRVAHQLIYKKRLKAVNIKEDPIFIIGFLRSGTTFLQNLLVQDPQWGYTSTLQATAPHAFLFYRTLIFKSVINLIIGKDLKRNSDNVYQALDLPGETDLAIGNLSNVSFFNGLHFPSNIIYYFKSAATFEIATQEMIDEWKGRCIEILKGSTYAFDNKRLIIKNTVDCCRVKILLEMFPNAKFIMNYRNPYDQFYSIKVLLNVFDKKLGFNAIDKCKINEIIIQMYSSALKLYFQYKNMIPKENLIEVKFENLEKNTILEVENIYTELGLKNFSNAKPYFVEYLNSLGDYKKNRHEYDKNVIEMINKDCSDMFNHWGYEKIEL